MRNIISGLRQEVEVANLFAKLGYFTRFHVQLYPRQGKISDIDVFCIRFDNHLLPTRNIIETKRRNDSASVIFQLYGLQNFYENCNAFFVNDKISKRTFGITSKLNIKVYSFNRLNKLIKKDLTYDSIDLTAEHGQMLINNLNFIKKQVNESLFWEYHTLWLEKNPFRKLINIQEMFYLTDELFDKHENKGPFLWFRKELFILAFLSLTEISSKCIELESNNIKYFIEDQFYNLGISKQKKLQLKEGIDILLKIIEEKIDEKIKFELSIIPEWVPNLTKIVKKIISNAKYSNDYLLINEQILKSDIVDKPQNIFEMSKQSLVKKILPLINSELLKILHKEYIMHDFEYFV